ncbi:MAG: restriction endonuclease subunit S [Muribaculaceae bacterium]|nr:restriction endonuclease subunit S [Muribaculaceae bacterium]MBJ2193304.1 restriction endonuclease subunit S [Muribaculaceae bacterium]
MDTQKLRQRILDLAIRGKLVPQDPNDEPASVLLDRIRAEKERLIAEGKIKRPKSKKSTDKSHYQNFTPPFDIPTSWEWVRLEDICFVITDGDHQAPPKANDGIPFLVISDIITGIIKFDKCRYVPVEYYSNLETYRKPSKGDILFTVTGSYGKSVIVETDKRFCFQRHIGLIKPILITKYLNIVLCSEYIKKECDAKATGTAQKTVGLESLRNFYIPIPPLSEQLRIIDQCQICEELLIKIDVGKKLLGALIEASKSKILDLAMQGKLVPQDPADEPATDMLRRINPNAKIITDNPHYPQLPDNWVLVPLEDITEYEQPQPYIVQDTFYSDTYTIPVLTAGKSFILGYTNEDFGVYENVPAIIFDDFTTDSKLVEFHFKVKSSAMKIIQVKRGLSIEYVAMFMSTTRLIGETHKRYWISEYSKILIPIPPLEEQNRIVEKVNSIYCELDKIISALSE